MLIIFSGGSSQPEPNTRLNDMFTYNQGKGYQSLTIGMARYMPRTAFLFYFSKVSNYSYLRLDCVVIELCCAYYCFTTSIFNNALFAQSH